jgi:universal stress protein A
MSVIQHILCPTDFSETAARAVKYAESLAMETGAELSLVHSFDIPATWTLQGQSHPRDQRLEKQLDEVLAGSSLGTKLHRLLHAGMPGEVICWTAQDRKCDLIVMGTHGRTGLKHLLFGSVAEYVLRHARCPVVTIRDRDPNEAPLKQPIVMPIPPPAFM